MHYLLREDSPCFNDVTFPPRPFQPQPTRYPVYGQQRNMTDESSSDEEDEDHKIYWRPREVSIVRPHEVSTQKSPTL
ncbi:hypothetical protein H5410_034909 [Solanum commersonii]|uniref:Uncharacterized protein n=1 Tax=Solanum commersonii TaxID=4109 RepID=A0A9J5Y0F6_SOLCO|nr:hypothetical protein H5410_034909 [Solanum commersonii]